MILMHAKCLEFCFCFTFRVERSEVVLEFHDKKIEIQQPNGVVQAQKYRFETVQCDPLQVGKGIVDLVFFSAEKILVIPKIQLALKYESTEFLGIRTIEWVGFPEFGLGCESMGLDEFIDGHGKSFSICFFLSCSHVWSIVRCFVISGVSMEIFV